MTLERIKIYSVILFIVALTQFLQAGEIKKKDTVHGDGWAFSTELEFQTLPEYCKARFYSGKSPFYKKWYRIIGEDFIHFHHY